MISITFYHHSGLPVQVSYDGILPEDAHDLIRAWTGEGFLTEQPAPGQFDEAQVSHVIRRQKRNEDGSLTDHIHLYAPWGEKRLMGIYLNTPDDVAAFEIASGLQLRALPVYDGDTPPNKDSGAFNRFAVPTSFGVLRHKAESDNSPSGYVWYLDSYLPGSTAITPPPPNTTTTEQPHSNGRPYAPEDLPGRIADIRAMALDENRATNDLITQPMAKQAAIHLTQIVKAAGVTKRVDKVRYKVSHHLTSVEHATDYDAATLYALQKWWQDEQMAIEETKAVVALVADLDTELA